MILYWKSTKQFLLKINWFFVSIIFLLKINTKFSIEFTVTVHFELAILYWKLIQIFLLKINWFFVNIIFLLKINTKFSIEFTLHFELVFDYFFYSKCSKSQIDIAILMTLSFFKGMSIVFFCTFFLFALNAVLRQAMLCSPALVLYYIILYFNEDSIANGSISTFSVHLALQNEQKKYEPKAFFLFFERKRIKKIVNL